MFFNYTVIFLFFTFANKTLLSKTVLSQASGLVKPNTHVILHVSANLEYLPGIKYRLNMLHSCAAGKYWKSWTSCAAGRF